MNQKVRLFRVIDIASESIQFTNKSVQGERHIDSQVFHPVPTDFLLIGTAKNMSEPEIFQE
jgi:hypothetical protein